MMAKHGRNRDISFHTFARRNDLWYSLSATVSNSRSTPLLPLVWLNPAKRQLSQSSRAHSGWPLLASGAQQHAQRSARTEEVSCPKWQSRRGKNSVSVIRAAEEAERSGVRAQTRRYCLLHAPSHRLAADCFVRDSAARRVTWSLANQRKSEAGARDAVDFTLFKASAFQSINNRPTHSTILRKQLGVELSFVSTGVGDVQIEAAHVGVIAAGAVCTCIRWCGAAGCPSVRAPCYCQRRSDRLVAIPTSAAPNCCFFAAKEGNKT
jgi:hypothetical protein